MSPGALLEAAQPARAHPSLVEGLREVPCCPVCTVSERAERFREGPYALVACAGCGLQYVTPRLEPAALLERVYDEAYWRSARPRERGYADYRADDALQLATFERRWRGIAPHLPPRGRVLDVGCASGAFLRVMLGHGWSVHGVEPSEAMRPDALRAVGAARLFAGSFDEAPLQELRFDLVTFWDVLEHLPDPVAALGRAAELLLPGGRVLVETQDTGSLAARLLGRRWHHYKHAEHLVHFHAASLDLALASAGLARVAATRRGAGKHVRAGFVVERSARIHPLLPRLLAPLRLLGARGLYVNLLDERIVLAARAADLPG